MKQLTPILAATAMLAIAAPAAAQSMQGMNMPGMSMPMPAKKKLAARPAAKRKQPASALRSVAKPKRAPPKGAAMGGMKGMDHGTMSGMDHSAMPGMDMSAGGKPAADGGQQGMNSMPGMQALASGQQAAPGTQQPMQGMDHSSMPGMTMPATGQSGAPGSQQDMQSMPGMQMSGNGGGMAGMSAMPMEGMEQTGTNLAAGNAPAPALPTDHAADRAYPSQAMAMARHHLTSMHGGQNFYQAILNLAEYQFRNGRDGYRWDGQAWFGGDVNRLFLKSEGEGASRQGIESAEVQALYSHAIGPYFNLQGGVRQDLGPSPKRTYATVQIEGLSPGFFELEAAAFLSNKGDLLGRLEGYYDQRITQRLILQPRVELNLAAQDVPENRIGSGLTNAELGLRLRYEIKREFAPYIGVSWDRRVGDTARFYRATGESASSKSIVAGVRMWF